MMWTPSVTIRQQPSDDERKETLKQAVDDIYDIPRHPISDLTQFVLASTTLDTQKINDPRFKEDFEYEIFSIDKFAPLSNIDVVDQQITRLNRMIMRFAKKFGFRDSYRGAAIENIGIYQESRGRMGFFQEALITQRQELLARQQQDEKKRKGWGIFRHKPAPEETPQQQQMMTQQGGRQ